MESPIKLKDQVAVVVLSCDAYSDLWPVFFETFFRFWPECPFKVYLAANQKTYNDARVLPALSGPDADWSSSMRRSLAAVREPYVFFLYDDAFFSRPVPTEKVCELLSWGVANSVNYFRLRPEPRPDIKVNSTFGELSKNALYRTSCYLTLWKKTTFLEILKDGESAWSFELEGTPRSIRYEKFYSTYQCQFKYIHGVEKGKWLRPAVGQLAKLSITPDLSLRRMMTQKEQGKWYLGVLKQTILKLMPPSFHAPIVRSANTLYRLVGLRSTK